MTNPPSHHKNEVKTVREVLDDLASTLFCKGQDWSKGDPIVVEELAIKAEAAINALFVSVLEELKEQANDAQYYIPNSPDDTYTTGEVVRLSVIDAAIKKVRDGR